MVGPHISAFWCEISALSEVRALVDSLKGKQGLDRARKCEVGVDVSRTERRGRGSAHSTTWVRFLSFTAAWKIVLKSVKGLRWV